MSKPAATTATRSKRGRGKVQRPGVSKCVYFPDAKVVASVESMLARFPRANLSMVLAQLMPVIAAKLDQLNESERVLEVNTRVYL